jgi:hypothetical protein
MKTKEALDKFAAAIQGHHIFLDDETGPMCAGLKVLEVVVDWRGTATVIIRGEHPGTSVRLDLVEGVVWNARDEVFWVTCRTLRYEHRRGRLTRWSRTKGPRDTIRVTFG